MDCEYLADVGNSRIKWGKSLAAGIEIATLPPDDPSAWDSQLQAWQASSGTWIVTGANPPVRERLSVWLRQRDHDVVVIDAPEELPLQVKLERPAHVGIDRLLNAVAANTRRVPGQPAVIVDAGSAVTVDWVDGDGAFCGGTIFPGLRLMSKALHDYTALLPLIEPRTSMPVVPATSTPAAVEAGVYWAVAGGISKLVARLCAQQSQPTSIFLTGGDAPLLAPAVQPVVLWPEMTLEGARLAARFKRGK